jgi:Uma2 family endonuclease
MLKTAIRVGPADHGKRMSLADFDHAEVQEGYLYELGRGVIVVSDVPGRRHLFQVADLRLQLSAYQLKNPRRIYVMAAGSECKLLLWDFESERHPDLSIYLRPPPEGEDFWSTWVPEIVIEVVSASSVQRDYQEKLEEYLAFGIREYWIVDADQQRMLVLRRWGRRWRETEVRPPDVYKTRLLPGFELDVAAIFRAAEQ